MRESEEPDWLAKLGGLYEALLPNTPPPKHVEAAFRREIAVLVDMLMAMGATTDSGSIALRPMKVSGKLEVQDRRGLLAGMNDGQILVLVLVWLFAIALPAVQAALPPEDQAVLNNYYATFAVALAITWRILDKRK